MVPKLVLLHFLRILLLIFSSNAIDGSESNVLEVFRKDYVNETDKVKHNETFGKESILKNDENVFLKVIVPNDLKPKKNSSDVNCKQIFRCENGFNIHAMYRYYNRAFQVILLVLFGIEMKLTKIKAILRNPIGPGIASFSCWILAPLVSEILIYRFIPIIWKIIFVQSHAT